MYNIPIKETKLLQITLCHLQHLHPKNQSELNHPRYNLQVQTTEITAKKKKKKSYGHGERERALRGRCPVLYRGRSLVYITHCFWLEQIKGRIQFQETQLDVLLTILTQTAKYNPCFYWVHGVRFSHINSMAVHPSR